MDKDKLTAEMTAKLNAEFPGVDFNFSQYIEDNVEEAASGVKGENSVRLFGGDLEVLEKTADKIKDVMATVPGVTDLGVFASLGQPTVRIDVDRARAARYGLAPGDVNSTVAAAIGGQAAGNLYEDGSDRNFPIVVRLAPEYRKSLDAIRHIVIGAPNPNGSGVVPIPLTDVAKVSLTSGASFIYREGQERYIPIKFSVRGRDLGTTVLEAQKKVDEAVTIPGGYHLEWVGEFGNLEDAIARLEVVVPLAIALICLLLFVNFGSLVDMLLAASVIPMALIGGIFALYATGTPFSVSATTPKLVRLPAQSWVVLPEIRPGPATVKLHRRSFRPWPVASLAVDRRRPERGRKRSALEAEYKALEYTPSGQKVTWKGDRPDRTAKSLRPNLIASARRTAASTRRRSLPAQPALPRAEPLAATPMAAGRR